MGKFDGSIPQPLQNDKSRQCIGVRAALHNNRISVHCAMVRKTLRSRSSKFVIKAIFVAAMAFVLQCASFSRLQNLL